MNESDSSNEFKHSADSNSASDSKFTSARQEPTDGVWTLSNSLCVFRLVGSVLLILLALMGLRYWFVGLYIVLGVTDLIDGPLARIWKQTSSLGARLDTLADVTLSVCMLIGVVILCGPDLRSEVGWIVAAVISYGMTIGIGCAKFGKIPSYHTYAAKVSHLLVALAAISLVMGWSMWPLRIAAIAVVITNLETCLITLLVRKWQTDVGSVFSVWPSHRTFKK